MLRIPIAVAIFGLALTPVVAPALQIERARYLMGTSLSITLEGPDEAALQEAASAAFDEVARLEALLSNWRLDSETSRLNRAAGSGPTRVSADLYGALDRALVWAERTGGAFEPAIEPLARAYDLRGKGRWPTPRQREAARRSSGWRRVHLDAAGPRVTLEPGAGIDTGGFGKGYALDRAAEVLRARGVTTALLDFGGQVLAVGAPEGERGWKIALADPETRDRPLLEVLLRDASLSTSGQSERSLPTRKGALGHVLDPRTGTPVPAWGSASAVARTGLDADALATAFLVLGPEATRKWMEARGEESEPLAAILLIASPGSQQPEIRFLGNHPGLLAHGLATSLGISCAAATFASAQAETESPPTNAELARRIDALAREIDEMRMGEVVAKPESRHGLGPAASRIYGSSPGLAIGGYGEALYERFSREDESGAPSGETNRLDLLRAVLYVGYKFSERALLNSEIEVEHATTGEGAEEKGEVSVEFAYLDFLLHPRVNLRGGLALVPVGWINELHEPPVFLGTRRPDVETVILPSTWSANGAGLFGDLGGGLSYRAYFFEGLRAVADEEEAIEGFTASEGIRGGRQNGSLARVKNWSGVARLDWRSRFGLVAGGSLYSGAAGQGILDPGGETFSAHTTVAEAHAEYRARGLWLRALYASVHVDDAERINATSSLTSTSSVGSEMFGWYGEGGYDVGRHLSPGGSFSLYPFVRYERYDTQDEVPPGFARDPANDRRVVAAGASFYPHPQIALKADHQWRSNEAGTGVNRFDLALSYLF